MIEEKNLISHFLPRLPLQKLIMHQFFTWSVSAQLFGNVMEWGHCRAFKVLILTLFSVLNRAESTGLQMAKRVILIPALISALYLCPPSLYYCILSQTEQCAILTTGIVKAPLLFPSSHHKKNERKFNFLLFFKFSRLFKVHFSEGVQWIRKQIEQHNEKHWLKQHKTL